MLLGEFRAKQSQDDKPPTRREPARTASVDYAPWSHPSLRSRRARKVCATWPLLPGLSCPPPLGLSDSGPGVVRPLLIPDHPQSRDTRARRFKPRTRMHAVAIMS